MDCGVTVARVPCGDGCAVQLTVVAATTTGAGSGSRCLVLHCKRPKFVSRYTTVGMLDHEGIALTEVSVTFEDGVLW